MKNKSSRIGLSLILLFAVSFAAVGSANDAAGGGPAPNFTLKSLTGKNMKLMLMVFQ